MFLLIAFLGIAALGVLAWYAHSRHLSAVAAASLESYEELQLLEKQFEAVFDGAPVGYQDIDVEGYIVRVNAKECQLKGVVASEIIGLPCWKLYPEIHQKRIEEEYRRKLSGAVSLIPIERNFLRQDGQMLTLEIHEVLLRDHKGNVIGLRSASIDITEPTKKQEAVWQATSELNAVFQAFPDMFLRVDSAGCILSVRAIENSEGIPLTQESVGSSLADQLPPEVAEALLSGSQRALKGGQLLSVEFSLEKTDLWSRANQVKYFEARLIPLHWNEVVIIVREITERKAAEHRLALYAEELKRKNAEVEAKNQEVEAKNSELEKALVTAREATKLKSQFLATMSHEIRTPMNGIAGMTEFLLGTALTPEQKEYADAVKSSADSLLVIINDILDLSKIEAGKMTVESIPFDLMAVVKEVASTFGIRARAKNLDFELDPHTRSVVGIRSDPSRIRQILNNLLGNALKFTEVGGIALRTKVISEGPGTLTIEFQVEDTGIGVASDQTSKLFQSFSQVDGSHARKYGGTGLGLAISRQFVEMMAGEIGYRPRERRGSMFWFSIPFQTQAQVEEPVAQLPEGGEAEVSSEAAPVTDGSTHEFPAQVATVENEHDLAAATPAALASMLASVPPVPASLQGLHVLLVGEPRQSVLRKMLQSCGCRIEEVSRVNSIIPALELAVDSGTPYRAAVVNTALAGLGGLALGRSIRTNPKIGGTAVIGAAHAAIVDQIGLRVHGFGAIVVDTCKPAEFDAALTAALEALQEQPATETQTIETTAASDSKAAAAAAGTPSAAAKATAEKRAMRILLAEDNAVNQKIALRLLEKSGLSADLARNGREAVEASQRSNYDLILMDCQMPEMDGFEATMEIRRLEKATSRHTPIVALTANAMAGDRERCLNSGMDDYVSKPFDVKALQGLIDRWLQQK
ncbi:hypothetical protein F183_A50810 [Bryobacterales bacterium F-183]|nr:hypothetical protein F183_A50810 [Bryobacterales bacterium F-183]